MRWSAAGLAGGACVELPSLGVEHGPILMLFWRLKMLRRPVVKQLPRGATLGRLLATLLRAKLLREDIAEVLGLRRAFAMRVSGCPSMSGGAL